MSEIDVLIVTALKEEYDAARDMALTSKDKTYGISRWNENTDKPETPYLIGKYEADGFSFTVALARATRMGSSSTSPIASSLVERLQPYCLAMCGVCAGNPGDVILGDVIVAEIAYQYDEGKQKAEGFEPDHRQFDLDEHWLRTAQDLTPESLSSYGNISEEASSTWVLEQLYHDSNPRTHHANSRYFPDNSWAERIKRMLDDGLVNREGLNLKLNNNGKEKIEETIFYNIGSPDKLPFQIKVGPMASGNVVVKDGITWDKLKSHGVRTVLGLEMEAATIGSIAKKLKVPKWIVVKGVMDYADPKKNDRIKSFSARASAEVLFKFLESQLKQDKQSTKQIHISTSEAENPNSTAPFSVSIQTAFETNSDSSNEKSGITKNQLIESEDTTKLLHKKAENKPFFNVPFASKENGFIGRKDKLTEIHDSLKSGAATHIGQAQNIQGMGGLGKTQLAVEYAHRYRDEYSRGVYWLTADADINNQLITIGEAEKWIFRDDKAVNQFDVARQRFLELKDCLIIFDNVESVAAIRPFIPADKKSIHLLITSREEQDGFRQIDLNVLSPADSRELLLSIATREPSDAAEKEAFDRLIEELDGLPLALELVGGYLAKRKNISFQNYLKYFNTEPLEKIEARFPDETFTNHDISIIRTLTISEELLNETPYLADILDVLAWSGSSPMSVSLLREMIQPESEFDFDNALALALELKLVKKDDEAERYAIHRLLGRVRRLEKPLEENQEWHQKTLNGLIKWFRDRKNDFKSLIDFEEMTEHLEKWESQSSNLFKAETASLIWLKAYPLWHRGNFQHSKTFLEEALIIYESNLINDQELKANIICDLGTIIGELGNYQESLKYDEQALKLRRDVFGDNHPDTALSYNNIGRAYDQLEDYQKALDYSQKALKIKKELFGNENSNIALSYNNVGGIYGRLNNHQKALEYKEKALSIRNKLFGDNHPDTALSYTSVGNSYGSLGKHRKNLEYQKKALNINKTMFGDKHYRTASSYNNVGTAYANLGDSQRALGYQEKALEIQQSFLGKHHPTTIIIAGNVIKSLQRIKNYIKAGQLANEYFKDVPQNHSEWKFFEEVSRPYRKKHNPFKKKRK